MKSAGVAREDRLTGFWTVGQSDVGSVDTMLIMICFAQGLVDHLPIALWSA